MKEEAKNPIDGVGIGLQQMMSGVADGITGVIKDPIKGAKQ